MKEKCTALVKARDKKGFTLMEMLIVVAIIAILIAIAIPTFSSQLEKARVSTDQANVRSAYAVMQTCKLLSTDPNGDALPAADTTWYMQKDGSFSSTATTSATAYVLQAKDGVKVDTVPQFTSVKGQGITITYAVATGTFKLETGAVGN